MNDGELLTVMMRGFFSRKPLLIGWAVRYGICQTLRLV